METEQENIENSFKNGNEVVDTDKEEVLMVIHKRIHVIKRGEGWAIKKEGASRATRIYKNKREAVEEGREFREMGYDLAIHKKDGSIQRWEKAKKKRTIKTPKVTGKIPRKAIEQAVKKVISKKGN